MVGIGKKLLGRTKTKLVKSKEEETNADLILKYKYNMSVMRKRTLYEGGTLLRSSRNELMKAVMEQN